MIVDRTNLVRQMQRTLQGADYVDERTVQMVEQLQERVRRLRSLDGRYTAVRLSAHVAECVSPSLLPVAG
jgi:hypothetical protein